MRKNKFGILAIVISLTMITVGIFIAYGMNLDAIKKVKDAPPIIQATDVKSEMVAPEVRGKSIGHRINDFTFTDQNGNLLSLDDIKGDVFIAEYFFTTCQTICPIMNKQMIRVQEKFKGNDNVSILSFTVDPATDTVEAMKTYAQEHNAHYGQWYFLTGNKKELYHLARNSFFILKPAETMNVGPSGEDFIHTNNFVLVDQKLRIRGYYDGTDSTEVSELMNDINYLLEYE